MFRRRHIRVRGLLQVRVAFRVLFLAWEKGRPKGATAFLGRLFWHLPS